MFSPKACEQLKHYVYLYIDPRTDRPFYVGKGAGNRCFSHLKDRRDSSKSRTILALRKLGLEPRIEILKYGLSEAQAMLVEATAIDLLDLATLTNVVRGHGSRHGTRGSVGSIKAILDARATTISEPAVLININREFRANLSLHDLYDVTRSAWKVGSKRHAAEYAFSIYRGVVREVFRISAWLPGGATLQARDSDGRPAPRVGRWEFVGYVAPEPIRRKYVGRSVAHYFKPGAQNPIKYVNC